MSLNIIELDENGNKILKKVAGNSDIVDTAIETDSTWSGYKINSVFEDITDKSHLITYTEWGQLGITEVQSITSLKDLLDKMDSQSYARLSIGTSNASAFYDKGVLPTTQPGILEVHKSSRINMIYSIDAGVKYSSGASSSSGDIKPWIQLPYITDDSTTSTVGTWSAKKISDNLFYKAGNEMNLNQIMCSGCISSSVTTILYTIPLSKPMVANSAKISDTKFSCRYFGGYVYINDDTNLIQMYNMTQATLENYCDITYYYGEGHVTVICKLKTGKFVDGAGEVVTNNIPVIFHITSGKLLFS